VDVTVKSIIDRYNKRRATRHEDQAQLLPTLSVEAAVDQAIGYRWRVWSALSALAPIAAGLALSGGVATASAHSIKPTVKPQIVGLVDKSSQASYVQRQAFPTVNVAEVAPDAAAFAGIVVNESWAQLEPAPGRFTFGPLRTSLAAVRHYNRVHPKHPLAVKLRFWGGFTAPGWAKTLGGLTPVTFMTPKASGTTGRWWTPAYRAAWSKFQHRLAAAFDSDPLIRSVAVSSCATLTAEPFVQSPNLPLHTELFADGWTSTAQQQCLQGAFTDYAGWKHTPIDYTFNSFVFYTPGKQVGTPDLQFSDAVMTRCANLRRSTGRSCILSNHALDQTAASTSRSAPVYDEIAALWAKHPGRTPVDFQTNAPNTFGGCAGINVAVNYHAQSLELWPASAAFKGFSAYPKSQLVSWARALRTGKALAC
jgi:hypothetical protein